MTTGELRRVKDMWDMGLPVKQIAHEVGYSTHYVYHVAIRNRDMFPYRYKPLRTFDEDTKAMWAARVKGGECSYAEVARQCGVSESTVYKWVGRYA